MNWLQILFDGLLLGTLYALIALGYTMVYGVLRFINFAHGEVFMLAAYAGMLAGPFCVRICGGPSLAAGALVVAVSMACGAAAGMLIERVAYRPLRDRPRITALITAIGVSLLLQNLAQVCFSATPRSFPQTLPDAVWHWEALGLSTTPARVAVLCVTPVLLCGLTLLVMRTKLGLAMRAIAQNPTATALMGVSQSQVIAFTFGLGSAMAGAGGALYCFCYPNLTPAMGTMPGLKAFVAAVLGGIGSLPGAALGAVLLGVIEGVVGASPLSEHKDVVAFTVLIVMLLVRPSGLLGRSQKEKV